MSDWGNVGFFYDYEFEEEKWGPRKVRGVVAKAYSWPGAVKMILHAYTGVKYFCDHREKRYTDYSLKAELFETENVSANIGDLNTAFDVFFDYGHVDRGLDMVRFAYEKKDSDLFAGDDTYGYFLVAFTGNPADGYELKYGYFYDGKLVDLRDALIMDALEEGIDPETEIPEEIEKALLFFEKEAVRVASEEEFWGIMEACEDCVKELWDEEEKE